MDERKRHSISPSVYLTSSERGTPTEPTDRRADGQAHSRQTSHSQPTAAGRRGEDLVAAELARQGAEIVARNFRCPGGEVDIVAVHGDLIRLVEVKRYRNHGIESLEYLIGRDKQRRVVCAARYVLARHQELSGMTVSFDVALVDAKSNAITYVESAFDGHFC